MTIGADNTLQQLANAASGNPVRINENLDAGAALTVFGQRHNATTGLTFAYHGGRIGSTAVAAGTVALTASATNYVVAHRSTLAVSVSTGTTNWNDTATYARLHKITTSASAITALEDHRVGSLFAAASAAAPSGIPGVRYTIDTGSTADSDPGAGLLKFNNATQSSATFLYIDDQTSDGVSLATYFASFGQSGYALLVQANDPAKWRIYKITAVTDGTGYRKIAVTHQAGAGSFADDAAVIVLFIAPPGTPIEIQAACSDETTALTIGTAKVTFRTPCAITLTGVRASLTTAQVSGSIFTVDINEAGTSVLSTKLTIDNTETTSTTAATAAVISDASLADDAEISVDIDQVGDGTAKGLKVTLIGVRT